MTKHVSMAQMQDYLIDCINPVIQGSIEERLEQLRSRFESEMLHPHPFLDNPFKREAYIKLKLEDWLRGLTSWIEVLYYDSDIAQFYQSTVNRECKQSEIDDFVEKYWSFAAMVLFRLLYTDTWKKHYYSKASKNFLLD